jgi:hypothetical protein
VDITIKPEDTTMATWIAPTAVGLGTGAVLGIGGIIAKKTHCFDKWCHKNNNVRHPGNENIRINNIKSQKPESISSSKKSGADKNV